ncbi:hypothetical protein SAMN06265367_104275 [Algoriphagus winogradskyi]|uniref:Uncharacterized protein n=1 Tax=Algoriphagus winogradskyi TaxID=237017 RepID=A0ABY1P6H7_9BACT|nr:hypothetical protein SAMN06265367_104275 [Algoriphagus winogradskyi]
MRANYTMNIRDSAIHLRFFAYMAGRTITDGSRTGGRG